MKALNKTYSKCRAKKVEGHDKQKFFGALRQTCAPRYHIRPGADNW